MRIHTPNRHCFRTRKKTFTICLQVSKCSLTTWFRINCHPQATTHKSWFPIIIIKQSRHCLHKDKMQLLNNPLLPTRLPNKPKSPEFTLELKTSSSSWCFRMCQPPNRLLPSRCTNSKHLLKSSQLISKLNPINHHKKTRNYLVSSQIISSASTTLSGQKHLPTTV